MCLSLVIAASISLVSPKEGATYDTHTPWVNEFLSHPAERSVKPEEPPLSPIEIKRRDEQTKKYEEWVAGGANIAENCVKYLKSIGVTDEEIQSIRDIMLEE